MRCGRVSRADGVKGKRDSGGSVEELGVVVAPVESGDQAAGQSRQLRADLGVVRLRGHPPRGVQESGQAVAQPDFGQLGQSLGVVQDREHRVLSVLHAGRITQSQPCQLLGPGGAADSVGRADL